MTHIISLGQAPSGNGGAKILQETKREREREKKKHLAEGTDLGELNPRFRAFFSSKYIPSKLDN